jgi:Flp pilus assembly CpaF family ATPase
MKQRLKKLALLSRHQVRSYARDALIKRLVRNKKPTRVVLPEVQNDDVMNLLQVMNTGHPGSIYTPQPDPRHFARLSRLLKSERRR